jgi:hypothetical protein
MKALRLGDVLVMERFDELIEILDYDEKRGEVKYWSDKHPEEIGTKNCRVASLWIILKYGSKVANVLERT